MSVDDWISLEIRLIESINFANQYDRKLEVLSGSRREATQRSNPLFYKYKSTKYCRKLGQNFSYCVK